MQSLSSPRFQPQYLAMSGRDHQPQSCHPVPNTSSVPPHETDERIGMKDAALESPIPESEGFTRLVYRFGRSNALLFLVWFALILILKWSTLTQPPVWDGSMSVFPAAITLADHNFDLRYLLDQPGYVDGGPNVHSDSLVTWVTALLIGLFGSSSALFPILHVCHFAVAAAAIAALYRFALPLLDTTLSAVATLAVLVFPLVLTQAGYMYLEMPMLAATTFALLAWTRGRRPQTIVWSVAAVLIKGSGIIVPLAISGMAFFDPRPTHRDRRFGALALAVPAAVLGVLILMTPSITSDESGYLGAHIKVMFEYLVRIPDLLVMLVVYLAATLLLSPWRPRHGREEPATSLASEQQTRILSVAFLVAAFLAFYMLYPVLRVAGAVLPRYYVQVFPFILFGLLAAIRRLVDDKVILVLLLSLIVWSGVNRNGELYPDNDINNFALIERSGAYTGLLDLQRAGIRAIEKLPVGAEVFYDQPAHYKLSYPLMGYAANPLPGGHSILHEEPYKNGRLEDFPGDFYMLYEYPWLGGEIIWEVRSQAEEDPNHRVEVITIEVEGRRSDLLHITRTRDR